LVFLHDRRWVGFLDGGRVGQARDEVDVALPGAEGREPRRSIRGREYVVLVDVRTPLVEVVGIAGEHGPDFPGVLLQDIGAGPDQPLLEVAVFFEDLAGENDG